MEQTIIDEYNASNSIQQQILIMAHFGRAIYYSQLLEQQYINMLAIQELCNKVSFTENDVNEIFDKYNFSRQTLGQYSKIIAKSYHMSKEDETELGDVIQMRNHYAHSYFRFNDVLFHSESGRLRMVKDFFRFTTRARDIDTRLEIYMSQYIFRNSITEDKLMSMMQTVKGGAAKQSIILRSHEEK